MYCVALLKGRYVIEVCKDQDDGVLLLRDEWLTDGNGEPLFRLFECIRLVCVVVLVCFVSWYSPP
ncbi:hypothetical protein B1L02_21030 [Pseudoalteromonas piscicida]|uniref:Uncharacterized protein n=1 Tax=Pseudoalteromonas piscicida TaxID=43662 RepID=A0AAD0W6S3_PSEO7|nr:hypothetical protein B1L02_21030 [Pseudoalteromonas piscicida]AXR04263.1 hypothetical protein D0511_20260 [Pseudoalteromonas piscicida]